MPEQWIARYSQREGERGRQRVREGGRGGGEMDFMECLRFQIELDGAGYTLHPHSSPFDSINNSMRWTGKHECKSDWVQSMKDMSSIRRGSSTTTTTKKTVECSTGITYWLVSNRLQMGNERFSFGENYFLIRRSSSICCWETADLFCKNNSRSTIASRDDGALHEICVEFPHSFNSVRKRWHSLLRLMPNSQ